MQIALHIGQLEPMQVAFFLAGDITQVKESVVPLAMFGCNIGVRTVHFAGSISSSDIWTILIKICREINFQTCKINQKFKSDFQ